MDNLPDASFQHVCKLAGEIGCRVIATPAYHTAGEYITEVLLSSGFKVETQELPFPDWACETTSLAIGDRDLAVVANVFSPACTVNSPILPIGTLTELEAASLDGVIPLLYGDLTKEPMLPKSVFYAGERDIKLINLLEEKRPAAILTVNPQPGELWRVIEDVEFKIASANVPFEVGILLISNRNRTVNLKISSRETPGRACNIIGRLPGSRSERIVLCAHYDTKVDTPGAWDNAAGVAIVLAAAQHFAGLENRPTLEVIAFGGEEYSIPVDEAYLTANSDSLDQILAVINVDGAGHLLGAHTTATFSASPDFDAMVAGVIQNYPGVVRVELWPQSDHSLFSMRGIPCIAIGSVGISSLAHTPNDTIEGMSPEKLGEATALVIDLADSLAEKEISWCRP